MLSQDDDRHRVEFRLPSNGASTVAVLGDFSQWDTVEMTVDDEGWWVELVIPTGTYHFGFMVDGEWFIPDNAPDTVPDEWGRRNATLVLEN